MITVTTTSGVEFRLLKLRMTSFHLDMNKDKHYAYRRDIRAAFESGAAVPAASQETPSQIWSEGDGWMVVHRSGVSIAIGCMRFSGVNYRKLRKWALSTR